MTTQLTIPPKARITEIGMGLPARMEYGDWLTTMGLLFSLERATRWSIGDGLTYGEQEYGEKYAQAMALSEATGMAVDSLRQAQWVAEQVAPERRRPNLSWSHHREVSAQEPEVQERLLAKAEENEWSVSKLRSAVRTYKAALESPDEYDEDPDDDDDDESVPHGTTGIDEIDLELHGDPEDGNPEVDPIEEWERAEEELEEALATIESMKSDDQAAEIAKLHERIAGLEGRLRGETNAKNEAVKMVKYYQILCGDIKDALGVGSNGDIRPKILELLQGGAS